jgi:hypothetical protein
VGRLEDAARSSLGFFQSNPHLLALSLAVGLVASSASPFVPVAALVSAPLSASVWGDGAYLSRQLELGFYRAVLGSVHVLAALAISLIYTAAVHGYLARRDRSAGSALSLLRGRLPRLVPRLLLALLGYWAALALVGLATDLLAPASLRAWLGPLLPAVAWLPLFFIAQEALYTGDDYDALEVVEVCASRSLSSAPAVVGLAAAREAARLAWQPAVGLVWLFVKDWQYTGSVWDGAFNVSMSVAGSLPDYALVLPITALASAHLYYLAEGSPMAAEVAADREAFTGYMASLQSYYGSYQYQPVQEGWMGKV